MKKIDIHNIKSGKTLIPCPYNNLKENKAFRPFKHERNIYSVACVMCSYYRGEIVGQDSILCSFDDMYNNKSISTQKFLITERTYLTVKSLMGTHI